MTNWEQFPYWMIVVFGSFLSLLFRYHCYDYCLYAFVHVQIKRTIWGEYSFNFWLCHQLLTNMVVAIIRSLDTLPFTPCFLWNGPSARFIPYTWYIPLTQMYRLAINLNLCLCCQKLLAQPLKSTLLCRRGSIQTRVTRSLRERSGTPRGMVTRF